MTNENDLSPLFRRPSVLIFFPVLCQLLVALTFDLGADEAHYMVYARHLDLSYFDHPPMVGWVHFVFNLLFGESLLSARLPAILIGAFCNFQLFRFLRDEGIGEKSAAIATMACGFCFQFFVLELFLLPDTLCLALLWPLLRATARVARGPSFRSWLALGLWLGLMGLSKYTAVFFLLPIACVILPKRRLSFLKEPGFYAAVLLAGVLISPVVIWNAQRDWLSFRYQGAHVLGGDHGWQSFLKSWVLQFAIYSPFLWVFAGFGLVDLAKRRSEAARFAFWTVVAFGGFFMLSSWRAAVLPHWPALFYLFTIPLGLAWALARVPRIVITLVTFTSVVIGLLTFLLVSGLGWRIPEALREVGGWPDFMAQVTAKIHGDSEGVALLNWSYGSRALFYARDFESKIFILDDRKDQFDLWNPRTGEGLNLWIVQFSFDEKDLSAFVQCAELSPKETIPIQVRGAHLYDIILQKCQQTHLLVHY